MKNQLSFEEAKRLSIIKWEAIVKQGGVLSNAPKEIQDLKHQCGFCERHKVYNDPMIEKDCKNCEFGIIAGECIIGGTLFNNWFQPTPPNTRLNSAKVILETIKSLKENS